MQHVLKIITLVFGLTWCLSGLCPPGLGFAQTHELEEIVVVSTPIIEGNQVDRYGAGATVVTEDQISDLNAQDLGTALRRTPGVNISRYNPIGSFGGAEGGGVFIRGMGSSRPGSEIKTFIDGVPMYMSVWNHPLLDLLSIDPASSIEVYKSPQPQHFGNAFGVINIDPKRMRTEGVRTDLKAAGGSYSTFIETAEHGGKVGTFDYYLGQSFRRSSGHRDNSDGRLTNYFGRVGMELGENWDVAAFGLHTDNFARDPGIEGREAATRQGKYETSAWLGHVTLSHAYEMFEGSLKVFANSGKGDWYDQLPPSKDLWNEFTFSGVRAREILRPWSGGEIIAGLDWDVIDGKLEAKNAAGVRANWDGPTMRILSPYVAVSQLIGDLDGFHAIPSAGVRHYNHNEFDAKTAPHAGLVLGYKNTQIHAGYSKGVLYPGLDTVVLSEYANPMLGRSWEDLKAETMDHYEIGISHSRDRLRADLTFFRDKGKDRYVIVPPPPPPPVFANIGDYRTQGVEATVSYTPLDDLSLFVGATFLDTDPGDLPYAPKTTLSAGLNWRFLGNFQLSLDGQYVSDMHVTSQARRDGAANDTEVDSYALLNGKLSYLVRLDSWNMDAELFIAGENLTNAKYEYLPGYPMPGINGMVGMALKF